MVKDSVSHRGRVVSADPQFITVEIISESACSSCHAAGLCSMSEQKVKQVVVPSPSFEYYEPGEEVNVSLKASMGHKAVWIAYGIPLFVLLAVIMGLLAAGTGELTAGLSGIGSVAVYYFFIWLFRSRLQDQYVFNISKLN